MFKPISSSYFFKRTPERFGSQQDDYIQQVAKIVAEGTQRLRDAVREKKDLDQEIMELFNFLGSKRQEIAQRHQTENAELFGKKREVKDGWGFTGLYDPYEEFNERLLPNLQSHLRKLPHTLREFTQKEALIRLEPCLGRKTFLKINIYSSEDKDNWGWSLTRENYERVCNLCNITPKTSGNTAVLFNELYAVPTFFDTIRVISSEDYKKIKLSIIMNKIYLNEKYSNVRKSDWVLATLFCDINGRTIALTQFFTWMYRDFKKDPVEAMTRDSCIFLSHQESSLINDSLRELVNLCKELLLSKDLTKDELIQKMSFINYVYAHAMPYLRGSAAIGEMLEMIMYQFHDFILRYKEDTSINMEALTSSLSKFVSTYPSLIDLSPVSKQSAHEAKTEVVDCKEEEAVVVATFGS